MPGLQEWIYSIEVGRGASIVRAVLAGLVFIAVAVVYDIRCYKNFSSSEAMDSAQLGRALAEGKGYHTLFVRPVSVSMLKKRQGDSFLKRPHPDLANAPAYPVVLAGLTRLLPFRFEIPELAHRNFLTYSPEVWIAVFNQFLFFCAVILTFLLASILFDRAVGWMAAIIFAGTELFWRFSVSGLPTMLLLLVFLGVLCCLVFLERSAAAEQVSTPRLLSGACGLGALMALGTLTRYSFGWLIIPVLIFLILYGSVWRVMVAALVLLVFAGCLAPWLVRNYRLCGALFGTAGYAVSQGTHFFPNNELERSLDPSRELTQISFADYGRKFLVNSREIVREALPKFGGNWMSAFFLAGLLIRFNHPTLSRIRVFLVSSLILLIVVQAFGRTHLTSENPEINSENLLVLMAPILFVYGVGCFFILFGQMSLLHPQWRQPIMAMVCLLASAPLIFAVLPPRSLPTAYPPYWPPGIQGVSKYMKEKELMMSDMPWAVAWYGQRQCCWLTLNPRSDFFKINDEMKPVQGLYLTLLTLDQKFLSDIVRDKQSWGRFVRDLFWKGEPPAGFPLRKSPGLSDRLFLTDWERWKVTESSP